METEMIFLKNSILRQATQAHPDQNSITGIEKLNAIDEAMNQLCKTEQNDPKMHKRTETA